MSTPPTTVAGAILRPRRGLLLSERKLLLAAGDAGAVGVAFLVAFNIHSAQVQGLGLAVPRVALGIVVVSWLVSAYLVDGYNLAASGSLRATFSRLGASLGIAFVGLLGVFFLVPYRITRPTLLLWLPLAAIGVLAWRLAYRRAFAADIFAANLVVLADPSAFKTIWQDAGSLLRGMYRVSHVVDPGSADAGNRLVELAATGEADQVILGTRDELSRELFRILLNCYDRGIRVRSLAEIYEEVSGRVLLDQLGHSWLMSLPMRSEASRLYVLWKRTMDLVSGAIGLLVLLIVLPIVALAIKLDDGGKVFFRQDRLGKYGAPFTIFKLRTMTAVSDGVQRQTVAGDVRVTRVGRVLRNLHIDELPQAWNVVRGDMSVIGPRPEQPDYVAMLQRQIDFYNTRLSVRPGLTGWAQVNFGYGEGVAGARVKLSYDLYYIKRQSPALDLLILMRTIFAVLRLRGN